jgi:hypothetical protein
MHPRVDDHAASEPKGAQDVVENVHHVSAADLCGVSINLSGNPIILANGVLT